MWSALPTRPSLHAPSVFYIHIHFPSESVFTLRGSQYQILTFSAPPLAGLRFYDPVLVPLNWRCKCHNTFWERFSTPTTKYIHGQNTVLFLLSVVSFRCEVCNFLSHLTSERGNTAQSMGEQEDGQPEPVITSPFWGTFIWKNNVVNV